MSTEAGDAEVVICRACVNECTEYKSLHKQGIFLGEVKTLAAMLSFVVNLDFQLDEGEGFPVQICERCVQLLAKAYAFKKMVLENTELLKRQYLEVCGTVSGGAESMEEVEESTASVLEEEEQHYENEEIVPDDGQLQGLATAAQFRRDMEHMEYGTHEYVTLSVLEDSVDGEDSMAEEREQYSVEHVEEDEEEVEVHEVEEGDELYHTENEQEFKPVFKEYYQVSPANVTLNAAAEVVEEEHSITDKRPYSAITEDCKSEFKPKMPVKARKKSTQPKPPNPELQCQVCGKQLSNQNSFKYHMQLHSDTTPYLCSLCGEGFKTRNAYEGHIVIHDPNNPNTCTLCGKAYRQSSSLRTHMLTHTGERPFQCDICGKAMTQKSGYKKHMLVHTGEKPHVCDVCGREFRYSSNLIAHKRCHSGEKPYECPHCKKGFPSSEQMKRHSLVHTGERPFPCDVCNKRFKRRSSLLAHRHTHDSEPEQFVDQKVCRSNVVELY